MTRIVFMGTPEFAVPVLTTLAREYNVVAVYTRADHPAGRGRTLTESPVKIFAREHKLALEQPKTLRQDESVARLREYAPDLIVVAAYGLILPQAVLDLPRYHSINKHASLLPRHRGASPITAAILAGDAETGITLMQMDAGLDTGPIIATEKIPIALNDTAATLTEKLARVGAELLARTLPHWLAGEITPQAQDNSRATMTRLVKKEDGLIDWNKPAVEIERMVRAYNPWPSAYTFFDGKLLKIWRANVLNQNANPKRTRASAEPGRVVKIADAIGVVTGNGVLELHEIQLEGRRALKVDEFARGYQKFVGAKLLSR